ncbi:MAG TPA: hypothetical protein V6D14_10700 [Coleofasciculaceae cyanobacterium]
MKPLSVTVTFKPTTGGISVNSRILYPSVEARLNRVAPQELRNAIALHAVESSLNCLVLFPGFKTLIKIV